MTNKELIEILQTFPMDLIVKDDCCDEIINPIISHNDFDGDFIMLKCLWNEPKSVELWEC